MTRASLRVLLAAGLVLCAAAGCREDVRQAGRKNRNLTVRTVSHYGVTLDEQASPEDVAYVLLRAIRDDVLADDDDAQRDASLDVQFDLCAANEIQRGNRTSLTSDEFIYNVVWRWTPSVSHYAGDFETGRAAAKARFHTQMSQPPSDEGTAARACAIRMEVHDPGGDPNAGMVMVIYLAKDGGFWRVLHLGFEAATRSIEGLRSAQTGGP